MLHPSLLAFGLAAFFSSVFSQSPGSFADGGDTQISAMMMFLGNSETVYILDKAESNAAQINGHSAWGARWDINTHQITLMDVTTNVFCASGMHLPNGSFVTFGGNSAVGPHDTKASQLDAYQNGIWDSTLQDFDGRKAIRLLNPCSGNFDSSNCQWFDNPSVLSMQKQRWYSAAEPLADGSIVIVGGFVNGGYINRNFPNIDPLYEGGGSEPTYEFFPSNGQTPQVMAFMGKTSGLNSYAHTYLMASGLMFVQANISTTLWNYTTNVETALPDMPNSVARVYPASGAVAMLPLTPANNYTQTILFCGGTDMNSDQWGDYKSPAIDTWNYPASKDCQRITPEPADGSSPVYISDDNMLDGRTMGQFIILPNGRLLVVNGALNGTAGYAYSTGTTPIGSMPFGMSLAAGPVGTPAIYDPNAPAGQRWSNAGLQTSNIARLYHSSAILLPDATVLIAGSNPNVDVNTTTIFPTTYKAEIFYPPYYSASRPQPQGVPTTLNYGGSPFDITIPSNSYAGSGNDAASNTTVVIIRPGFTTHAMNMGQRFLQLNNTFTVNSDNSITLHVSQVPPNPNLFTPGPAMLFVNINGIPSNATMVTIGNGQMGQQPTAPVGALPDSVLLSSATGSANGSTTSGGGTNTSQHSVSHTGAIIGGAVGAVVVLGLLGALFGICISRRRGAGQQTPTYGGTLAGGALASAGAAKLHNNNIRGSDGSVFEPLRQDNHSNMWNTSTASLNTPYQDEKMGATGVRN